jgi:hypothetical protein
MSDLPMKLLGIPLIKEAAYVVRVAFEVYICLYDVICVFALKAFLHIHPDMTNCRLANDMSFGCFATLRPKQKTKVVDCWSAILATVDRSIYKEAVLCHSVYIVLSIYLKSDASAMSECKSPLTYYILQNAAANNDHVMATLSVIFNTSKQNDNLVECREAGLYNWP